MCLFGGVVGYFVGYGVGGDIVVIVGGFVYGEVDCFLFVFVE